MDPSSPAETLSRHDAVAESLSRQDVDRTRRVALLIGGRETVGGVALADEVRRLHLRIAEAYGLLQMGEDAPALALLAAEVDPSWDRPIDNAPPRPENRPPDRVGAV